MDTWQNLSPTEQAALVGLVVSGLMYLGRLVWPPWFEDTTTTAKFQRTLTAVLLSGAAVLAETLSTGGWPGVGAFLLAWAIAYASAEGAHTLVSRSSALR